MKTIIIVGSCRSGKQILIAALKQAFAQGIISVNNFGETFSELQKEQLQNRRLTQEYLIKDLSKTKNALYTDFEKSQSKFISKQKNNWKK